MTDKADKKRTGHRQRLRERFIAGEESATSELSLLELLLTYAVPQKDVKPIASELLAKFGSLSGVLEADRVTLCASDGIKESSAVLIKLVDLLRQGSLERPSQQHSPRATPTIAQTTLFEPPDVGQSVQEREPRGRIMVRESTPTRRKKGLFAKAVLKEAITLLPRLPETESLEEVREFLRNNLHFSAEQTRRRYTNYIVSRVFEGGTADAAIRRFAKRYEGRQELRDACFYRFCKAEPVMQKVIDELFLPSIGAGRVSRDMLRTYLAHQFPSSKSIKDSAQAIIEALADGGMVQADRARLSFGYREILLPSFAFVLHSEFPEPGMYPIERLELSPGLRVMFWNPDRLLSCLYELRNRGLISKVSEIDTMRQFTTKLNLEQVVERLTSERASA